MKYYLFELVPVRPGYDMWKLINNAIGIEKARSLAIKYINKKHKTEYLDEVYITTNPKKFEIDGKSGYVGKVIHSDYYKPNMVWDAWPRSDNSSKVVNAQGKIVPKMITVITSDGRVLEMKYSDYKKNKHKYK